MSKVLENLKTLLQVPDLASKKWIYEQYDSQVMNDTLYTRGDAAIKRGCWHLAGEAPISPRRHLHQMPSSGSCPGKPCR